MKKLRILNFRQFFPRTTISAWWFLVSKVREPEIIKDHRGSLKSPAWIVRKNERIIFSVWDRFAFDCESIGRWSMVEAPERRYWSAGVTFAPPRHETNPQIHSPDPPAPLWPSLQLRHPRLPEGDPLSSVKQPDKNATGKIWALLPVSLKNGARFWRR